MATFVLVHGSFSASWCWREIVSQLETLGHRAVVLDLPAHGANDMPIEQVTLRDYVDAVSRVVRRQDAPPILVGHSFGGPVAGVAESEPDTIAALVFVAGLLPPNGAATLQAVEQFDPAYLAQAVWASDRRSVWISPEGTRDFLCSSCSGKIVDEVVRRMTPEPIAPYEAPVTTTDAHFGRTRRYYIETRRDKVVPLSLQRAIQAQVGFTQVLSLDTDHVPFLSAPKDLASCLSAVAADVTAGR